MTEKDASGTALPTTTFTYHTGTLPDGKRHTCELASISNGYGGTTTFAYEAHTLDGWSGVPWRLRVKSQTTESGVGTAGGESSTIATSDPYGT